MNRTQGVVGYLFFFRSSNLFCLTCFEKRDLGGGGYRVDTNMVDTFGDLSS